MRKGYNGATLIDNSSLLRANEKITYCTAGVGGSWDINGNPANANSQGSGRNPAFALNGSSWGYGPAGLGMTNYVSPNTSLNKGQVII